MATTKRPAAQRRRGIQQQQKRNVMLIGIATLLVVVVIGGVAVIGRQASNPAANAQVQVSTHPSPASAEPNGRAWGPKDAPITVIEYADYQCESCGYFAKNFEQVFVETFADTGKVRFEIHNAPFHGENAERAAQAAYCAADQNMFWPMHDSLFLNQPAHGVAGFGAATLNGIAARIGLNTNTFGQCLSSGKYAEQVKQDYNTAIANNVTGTPTFVVNGEVFTGPLSTADFRKIFAEVAPDVTFE